MKGDTIVVIGGLLGLAYLFRKPLTSALNTFSVGDGGGGGGGGLGDTGTGTADTMGGYPLGQPMLPGGAYQYGFYDPSSINTPGPAIAPSVVPSPKLPSGGVDILPGRLGPRNPTIPSPTFPSGGGSAGSSGGSVSSDLSSGLAWGAGMAAGGIIFEKATGGLTKIVNLVRGRVVPSQAAENIAARSAATDAANAARTAETRAASGAGRVESAASKMLGSEARAAQVGAEAAAESGILSRAGGVAGRTLGAAGKVLSLSNPVGATLAIVTAPSLGSDVEKITYRATQGTAAGNFITNVVTAAAKTAPGQIAMAAANKVQSVESRVWNRISTHFRKK